MAKEALETLLAALDNWAAFFILLVVIGVGGELFIHLKQSRVNKKLLALQHSEAKAQEGELARLNKDASDAKTAQQKVEIDLDKQRELTARAQKDLLELQERVKPRHLTAEQKSELILSLKSQPMGQLEIRSFVGNPESRNFSLELAEAFEAGGWLVQFSDNLIMTPPPVGIKLWLHTDQTLIEGTRLTEPVPDRAVSILKAFEYAHVNLQLQFNPDVPKGVVRMIVGFKP